MNVLDEYKLNYEEETGIKRKIKQTKTKVKHANPLKLYFSYLCEVILK